MGVFRCAEQQIIHTPDCTQSVGGHDNLCYLLLVLTCLENYQWPVRTTKNPLKVKQSSVKTKLKDLSEERMFYLRRQR